MFRKAKEVYAVPTLKTAESKVSYFKGGDMNYLKRLITFIACTIALAGCSSTQTETKVETPATTQTANAAVSNTGVERAKKYQEGQAALQKALKERVNYWYGKKANGPGISEDDAQVRKLQGEAISKWVETGKFRNGDLDEILNYQDQANLKHIFNSLDKIVDSEGKE